jgi:G patch domain/KOW motif-containing protein
MAEASRVTFKLGGVKRPVLNNVASSTSQFDSSTISNNDQREIVTGFDNGEIKSNTSSEAKKELVITSQPNAHNKFLKLKTSVHQTIITNTTVSNEAVNQLNDDAKRALILEAQQANEAWNERNENGTVHIHTIEQDSTNTFMNNLETEENITEEKDIENADYDQVPIEEFGMAVLRGMGYKEDVGLGISNKKKIDVFVPETRPRGLGLGADRKILENLNKLKRNLKQAGIDEKDDLCFEKGAFVLIEKGPHQDQYGTIESIEEDTARLTVSLAIGGTNKKKEVISISQYNVKLVTEKEFLKYSKYVNKSKAEQVEKETSDQLMKDYHRRADNDDDKDYKHRHSSNRDDNYKRHRSSKNDDDDDRKHHHHSSNGHRHRHEESSRSRKH